MEDEVSGKPKQIDSATSITDLPQNLLIEILHRLPLKLSKQCMAVSKNWYSLMSTPYFAHRFLQINRSSLLFLNCIDKNEIRMLENGVSLSEPFSFSYLTAAAEPIELCNDLVLCCSIDETRSVYYICNPLTRRWIQLPPCPPPYERAMPHGFIIQGSGAEFRYAVVRFPLMDFSECSFRRDFVVQVFTSDSARWSEKRVKCRPEFGIPVCNYGGVTYKGMLFWMNWNILFGVYPFSDGENCRLIGLPQDAATGGYSQSLGVCKGNLRLTGIQTNHDRDVLSIRIWDFEDCERGGWHLEHDVSFSGLLQTNSTTWFKDDDGMYLLACDPNNGDVVYILMGLGTTVSCNLHKKTLDVILECEIFPAYEGNLSGALMYELPWQPTPVHPVPLGDDI